LTAKNTLYRRSIALIESHQDSSGAYVASPNFQQYQYCWLRDSSFIAHAMDQVGKHESSRAYFRWVDHVLKRYAEKVTRLEKKLSRGKQPEDQEFLHTRYLLNGEEGPEDTGWGNFQIDGYGTWLWALAEHVRLTGDAGFLKEMAESIGLTCRYLKAAYRLPCFDLWEENPDYLHTYSLGAVYGGLQAITQLSVEYPLECEMIELVKIQQEIKDLILRHGVLEGRLVKHLEMGKESVPDNEVDASLIAASTPYGLLPPDDEIFSRTIAEIEQELVRKGGGVYRFCKDTYYGGGEWVLLAGWLGWHYARTGRQNRALEMLLWMEDQADSQGQLPEQVSGHLLFPDKYQTWVEDWGVIALPLLWSHAMYLILHSALSKNS